MDLGKMMGKMKDVQAKMEEVQAELAQKTHTAEAGAGMVKVTVNGNRQLMKIEVDPEQDQNPNDREMVYDLVVAATNKALKEMDEIIQEEMQKRTSEFMPNIPGMDFNQFGNK